MLNRLKIPAPQRAVRVGIAVVMLVLIYGCAIGYEEKDPWKTNPKKIPDDQGISLGALVDRGADAPSNQRTAPVVDDPAYQEYLEWKQWQEFKRYQEWKRKQEQDASQ